MSDTAKAAVEEAKKHLGTKYKWGGCNPEGFDNSGFVQYCYKQVGVHLPKDISELINNGKSICKDNLKVGDLVFPKPNHVGLYIGNNKFIHCPRIGDVVKISSVNSFYTGRRVA